MPNPAYLQSYLRIPLKIIYFSMFYALSRALAVLSPYPLHLSLALLTHSPCPLIISLSLQIHLLFILETRFCWTLAKRSKIE